MSLVCGDTAATGQGSSRDYGMAARPTSASSLTPACSAVESKSDTIPPGRSSSLPPHGAFGQLDKCSNTFPKRAWFWSAASAIWKHGEHIESHENLDAPITPVVYLVRPCAQLPATCHATRRASLTHLSVCLTSLPMVACCTPPPHRAHVGCRGCDMCRCYGAASLLV